MQVGSVGRRPWSRLSIAVAAAVTVGVGACSQGGDSLVEPPNLPGEPPVKDPQLRAAAFILDIDARTGKVKVTKPVGGVNAAASFAPEIGGPSLSIVGGDVVDISVANFAASLVGAACAGNILPGQPGKVCTTVDLSITNKLASVQLVGPTVFPIPPASTSGALLFPYEITVTTTPGGATGGNGQGNDVLVENPAYGAVVPNDVWDGSPHNFFNDAGCPPASNDCYHYEEYPSPIVAGATTNGQKVGFFTDATVGQFRVRLLVAADLQNSGAAPTGTVAGNVTSPQIGDIANATVTVQTGNFTGTTNAAGDYSIGNVTTGAKTVSVSNLPSGCTIPASQNTTVNPGATSTVDFSVTCQVPSGTVSGTVTSSLGGGIQNASVTAAPGGSANTNASGAYSIAGVPVGSGQVSVSNLPSNCTAPASQPYTITTAGQVVTVDFVAQCTAPPPNSFIGTWSVSGTTASLELRVNVTSGNIGSMQAVFAVPSRLTYTGSSGAAAPILGNPSATTPPATSVTFGGFTTAPAGATGNLGIIRLDFTINSGPATTLNLQVTNFGALNNAFAPIGSSFGCPVAPATCSQNLSPLNLPNVP
jgi:hypothetical protein